MKELIEFVQWVFLEYSEFWSAIIGSIVGGLIAYLVQLKALREDRKKRREDYARIQSGLANALLFKTIRIHSNIHNIYRSLEDYFEKADKAGLPYEPWQIVLPFGNLPELIHFSPDEMGLALGLKNDEVFNMIVDIDVIHNGLIESVRTMNRERKDLGDRIRKIGTDGNIAHIGLSKEEYLAIRPKMIEVNDLIEQIRTFGKTNLDKTRKVLFDLHNLLRKDLMVSYKLELKNK